MPRKCLCAQSLADNVLIRRRKSGPAEQKILEMDPNPARYRARVRKIIELYGEHFPGESISHQNISAYARWHGWSRDKLVANYKTATQRKAKAKMAAQVPQGRGVKRPDDGKNLEVYKAEVVELNSDFASEVEIKHRIIGHRMIVAAMEVLD